MSRSLTIENVTHWKSSDILRIVRAARDEAGADPRRSRHVTVKWQTRNASRTSYRFVRQDDVPSTNITIWLPKRGSSVPHPNTMIALAAAGIDSSTPLLAVSESYFLANALVWEFAREVCNGNLASVLMPARRI